MTHLVMFAGAKRTACDLKIDNDTPRLLHTFADERIKQGHEICVDCYVAARPGSVG